MIDFLLRTFVKDYKNIKSQEVRTQYGILGSLIGLVLNTILVCIKLTVGIIFFNLSIIADALNNLSDFLNCGLNFFGFKLSNKPADEGHPYGHQRIEYVMSLIISIVIILMGGLIIYQAIEGFFASYSPMESFPIISIIILCVSIFIKLIQALAYFSLGKRISSISLIALGKDARNDIIATTLVILGIIISFYTSFYQIDNIISIFIGLFIIYTGIQILRESSTLLIGEKPDPKLVESFVNIVKNTKGVLGIHDLEMHLYGPSQIFASVHVEVDGSKNVYDLHEIIDELERHIEHKLNIKTVIHMDPIKLNDPLTEKYKSIVSNIINNMHKNLSFHDFRIVEMTKRINVIFDVVIPNAYKKEEKEIITEIKEKLKNEDKKIHPIITIDEQYTLISRENN